MGEKKVKLEVSDEVIRQISARRARGIPLRDLEKEFGFSRPVVNRLLATELARQVIKDVSYDIVAMERAQNSREVAELLPMAVEVVKKKLEEGDLKAAEMVFRVSGQLAQQNDKSDKGQVQAIQVILPGAVSPKEVINVNNDIQEGF